jgi:hypothetical protein
MTTIEIMQSLAYKAYKTIKTIFFIFVTLYFIINFFHYG